MKLLIIFCVSLIVCIRASKYDSFVHPLSDEFIDLVNEKATSWKAGRTFPKEISMEHLKRLVGFAAKPKQHNSPALVHNIPDNFSLPDHFDAREAWPHCPTIGEIFDTGLCSSAWAVHAVGVMNDRTCISSNGENNFRYSVEDAMTCCYRCWDKNPCYGGWASSVYEQWIENGIVSGGPYNSSEGCSPYLMQPCEHFVNGDRPQCVTIPSPPPLCQRTCQPGYNVSYNYDLHVGEHYYHIDTVQDAQYELIKNGSFTVIFDVFNDFLFYKSGVYQHTNGNFIGRIALRVIGYGTEDGADYWLCANAWNTDWGDNGFVKVRRGTNESAIEDFMETVVTK